jgi:hypothetical protein
MSAAAYFVAALELRPRRDLTTEAANCLDGVPAPLAMAGEPAQAWAVRGR